MTLAALLCLSCATPFLNPRSVEVEELGYGLYAEGLAGEVLVETTDRIPCQPDAMFGMQVRISFPDTSPARLPVQFEIREPVIPGVRPASELRLVEPLVISTGMSPLDVEVVNTFKGEFDLVEGEYQIRVIDPDSGLPYHERAFFLRSCACETGVAL